MGDFERTFGAGADAVDIISSHTRSSSSDNVISTGDSCPRCHGTGRIRQYKHIEDGKCFRCHGTGMLRVEARQQPTSEQNLLLIRLDQLKAPTHDCFGALTKKFNENLSILTDALGGKFQPAARVSIGDVATAFDPTTAVSLAMDMKGVERKALINIALLSAERAAIASNEQSLKDAIRYVQQWMSTGQNASGFEEELENEGDSTVRKCAKQCASFLMRIPDAVGRASAFDTSTRINMTLSSARYVFDAMEEYEGRSGKKAFSEERARQISDVTNVSPLYILQSE